MDALDITGAAFHPEWNYTIKPRQLRNRSRYCSGRPKRPGAPAFALKEFAGGWLTRLNPLEKRRPAALRYGQSA